MNPLYLSGYKRVDEWVVHNHWDSAVTSRSLELLGLVSRHHALFLIVLIAYAALHIFNSLLLVIGALLEKRLMLIPWMVQVRNFPQKKRRGKNRIYVFFVESFNLTFNFSRRKTSLQYIKNKVACSMHLALKLQTEPPHLQHLIVCMVVKVVKLRLLSIFS